MALPTRLVTGLGTIRGLRVISRQLTAHFKGSAESYCRKSALSLGGCPGRRRGTACRGPGPHHGATHPHEPEQHIWAQSYERRMMNILDIQRQIARAIAESHPDAC